MFELAVGGRASGKSEYAENKAVSLCKKSEHLIYLATMKPFGEVAKKRIERHRELRKGKGFETIERYCDIGGIEVPNNSVILLECMSTLLATEMFDVGGNDVERIVEGVKSLKSRCCHLVVVSNLIFSDGKRYEKETQDYIRKFGHLNRLLAREADVVTHVMYSIPIRLEGIIV